MPKLNQRGVVHLLVPVILLIGIIAGVYLLKTGNLKLFSKATNPPIVFKNSQGQIITTTTSPTVKIELTSTLGGPKPSPAVSGPVNTYTVSYRIAENPTDLTNASSSVYLAEPTVLDYTFKNQTPGMKFIWVEFKDTTGKTDRRTAQIELITLSGGFGQAITFMTGYAADSPVQYFKVPVSSKLDYRTPSTIELWFRYENNYPGRILTRTKDFNSIYGYTDQIGMDISQPYDSSKSPIGAYYHQSLANLFGQTKINPGIWNHVAVVIDSNGSKLFINGKVDSSRSGTSYSPVGPTGLLIGRNCELSNCGGLNGVKVDEVRISNVARYSSDFNVPTAPFQSDSSTIALWHFDGNATDASANHLDGQVIGGATFTESMISTPTPTPSPTPTPTPTPTPITGKRVFVTSTTYNGNLGGLSGADAKCQERANAANLGGVWKAWLSDSKTSASSRLTHSGPYLLLNGTKVFNNWGNSWGGISYGAALSPINMTELKTTVTNNVWTNTSYNGGITNKTPNQVCNDWTNGAAKNYGYYGMSSQRTIYWTSKARQTCNINSSLYCFEQGSNSCTLCSSDINKDGAVNGLDVSYMVPCMNRAASSAGTDGKSCVDRDSNKDGWVNQADVECIQPFFWQEAKTC